MLPALAVVDCTRRTFLENMGRTSDSLFRWQKVACKLKYGDVPLYGVVVMHCTVGADDFSVDPFLQTLTNGQAAVRCHLHLFWDKAVRRSVFAEYTETHPRRCYTCGMSDAKLKFCARCKYAVYCSKACQVSDWGRHSEQCIKA
jgi:hypothetical protein